MKKAKVGQYHWKYCKRCRGKTLQKVYINPIPRPQRHTDDRDDGIIWQCVNYRIHK
jgi:hypothetical protein